MLRVVDARTGKEVERDAQGAFVVWDQRDYLVQAEDEVLKEHPPVLCLQVLGGTATLSFENYVGMAELSGHRFRVQHGKLTDAAFHKMLDGVVADVADLAFAFGSPTSMAFERDASADSGVAYHALAYLRQVMRRAGDGERLLGQFLQIAKNPHRRLVGEPQWVATGLAPSISTQGLMAIATHPERLTPISPASRLRSTGLGQVLSKRRGLFPGTVLTDRRTETVNTHENRLVKHVLRLALDLVRSFERRKLMNPDLRGDIASMREELEWMATFEFLADVDDLSIVPFQSSVMQRREGYREFLQHYVQLGMASSLAGRRDLWQRLLDLKDGALLYEIWAFFEVKRVLDKVLGEPKRGELTTHDDEHRIVPWSAKLEYPDVELIYNGTYGKKTGSYSVAFRPDVVVRKRTSIGWNALVLDAKLKFDGARLAELDEDDPDDWSRTVTRADTYKMHTYRDAISEAIGAFVLYPGTTSVTYRATPNSECDGVGAVPLLPGAEPQRLTELILQFL